MCPGIWDPVFDEQHLWPLSLRSQESATRARLSSCDWATHKHYCRSGLMQLLLFVGFII